MIKEMRIPGPRERTNTDEAHVRDYPVFEHIGQNVVLCVIGGEVYGAALVQDGAVIEEWTAAKPLKGKTRETLQLTGVSPLTAQFVRLFHKPDDLPQLMVGRVHHFPSALPDEPSRGLDGGDGAAKTPSNTAYDSA